MAYCMAMPGHDPFRKYSSWWWFAEGTYLQKGPHWPRSKSLNKQHSGRWWMSQAVLFNYKMWLMLIYEICNLLGSATQLFLVVWGVLWNALIGQSWVSHIYQLYFLPWLVTVQSLIGHIGWAGSALIWRQKSLRDLLWIVTAASPFPYFLFLDCSPSALHCSLTSSTWNQRAWCGLEPKVLANRCENTCFGIS